VTVGETAGGSYSETNGSAQLNVSYPATVVIDPTTPNPVQTLIGALEESANPLQSVELCNVDLDFTGFSNIVIDGGRSLIASPACARGARNLGPRIFVTDRRSYSGALFEVRDSNVRLSGFRLEGPTTGIGSDDNNLEAGIEVFPYEQGNPTLIQNIEISNMEISYWSGAAIRVTDNTAILERGRLTNQNVSGVHVVNNYLHHNRHYDGDGYGVAVVDGGYALIERNVFEENRHAIAGGSSDGKKDYSGYTARDNLILPGGGLNCDWFTCWQTHQIDMHGDQSTLLGGDWCCGTAGETIIIQRNTILYTGGFRPYTPPWTSPNAPDTIWESGLAIKIRGNPLDKAVLDGNVFKHWTRDDAIAQNGNPGFGDNITNPIIVLPNNVFGSDPEVTLGSCDFAGDGQDDQFMATGVTWWAKSTTTLQWRYLNTMPELLPEIALGKFDNDAVCDVAPGPLPRLFKAPSTYSKSGTGPWVPFRQTIFKP
jgi:hypothetical protein